MSRRVMLIPVCLVTIAVLYLVVYRPKIAPWVRVIKDVNTPLADNPEFEKHLDSYAHIGTSGGNLPLRGRCEDIGSRYQL